MSENTRKYLEAEVIVSTKDMSREDWLKARQMGIGGSDASAVAGLNPWKSAMQVYIDKKEENPKELHSFRMEYLEAEVIVSTKDMSREDWLKARQMGIGGSDASAVAGLNPWKSAMQVYIDKKEENPKELHSFRMELGNKLEQTVADIFTEQKGLKTRNVNGLLRNPKYPFATANIDRAIVGEKAFLECKTTNSYAAKDWEDGKIPINYEIQCYHYMAVTGAEHCYIAALIGNQDFVIHKIERDEETINQLMAIEKEFWEENVDEETINQLMAIEKEFWEENVLKDVLPDPDGSYVCGKFLDEKYKNVNDDTVNLSYVKDSDNLLNRYEEIKSDIKDLEKEKNIIEQIFKEELKEAQRGTVGDRVVTWKAQERVSIDSKKLKEELPEIAEKYSKKSSYRVFKIK